MISRAWPRVASGVERGRIEDDSVGAAFDLLDLLGLPLDGHVLVDDAKPPLQGKCDGHFGFGHGIHRGAEQRDVQADALREPGGDVDLGRHDLAITGLQQNVVEGQSLDIRVLYGSWRSAPRQVSQRVNPVLSPV